MSTSVSLTLQDLNKIFVKDGERFAAVDHVNLTVQSGEFLTFLGPSGCGKTTTLRMIAGFETPTSGKILIGEQDVTSLPVNERHIGFVFQNYALFPHMKIFDNVAYGLRVRNEPTAQIAGKVHEALAMVGLERAEGRYPNQLSGGEQQRVALARVLVLRPRLLLMDEPLSNLDAKLRLHMRTEIRKIQQDLSLTCLYVTHDQKEALTMSDRIMVMKSGHIEQIGTPMELYSDPATAFVADFIGQANLIPGVLETIDNQRCIVNVNGIPVKARLGKQHSLSLHDKVLIVVRPENLTLSGGENSLKMTVQSRQFEGDRVDYQAALLETGQIIDLSEPFLPNSAMADINAEVSVSFASDGAVVIPNIM